jgi:hypothetical protein
VAALLALACAGAGPAAFASEGASPERPMLGWLEWVTIEPGGPRIKAKLDTGATTSSIDARDEHLFIREGEPWVRFRMHGRDGVQVERESRVKRFVRIRRHGKKFDERPVIEIDVCVGGILARIEATLADRRGFVYPILLGRNFLAGAALVDASRAFTAEPECAAALPPDAPAEL